MNAIVLAGGYGTRLKPLTDAVPKPMLTIANRPILDYCVAQLYHYGIRDIVFTLGYKPEQIVEWAIGYTGISTHFSSEDVPLGTLGGVKAAKEFLDDTFIVLSGDGISDINLNALLNRHLANKALVTAVVKKCDNPQLYGVANLGSDGFIEGFIEKPHNITQSCYINCGAYVMNKSALDMIKNEKCDFARDLFPLLVKLKKLGYYEHNGYWQDVGDIKSYYETNFDILKGMGGLIIGGSATGSASVGSNSNNVISGVSNDTVTGRENSLSSGFGVSGGAGLSFESKGANGGAFFNAVKNFNDNKYHSKLHGNLTPSLVNISSKPQGYINECVIGGDAEVSRSASLDRCIVLPGAKAEERRHGCIIGEGFCVDVFDTIGQKEQSVNAAFDRA